MKQKIDKKYKGVNEDMNSQTPASRVNPFVDAMTKQISQDPDAVVNGAWDTAVQTLNPQSSEDWTNVVNTVTQNLGLGAGDPSRTGMSVTPSNPSTTLTPLTQQKAQLDASNLGQNTLQPLNPQQKVVVPPSSPSAPNNTSNTGYPRYGESVESTTPKHITKLEQAEQMIKDMKKKKLPDNNIIFSIVNRLALDVETVTKIMKKQLDVSSIEVEDSIVDKKPKEVLFEDNIYNHISVNTKSTTTASGFNQEISRDPFDWELSSTEYIAKALIINQQYVYEVKFEIIRSNNAQWPKYWDCLKHHNVNEVLMLTTNQIKANSQYLTIEPESQSISSNKGQLITTIGKVFKSYQKLWGKTNFQVVVLHTEQEPSFQDELAIELQKSSNIKIDTELSDNFMRDLEHEIAHKDKYYVLLKNSSGRPIKESYVSKAYDKQTKRVHEVPEAGSVLDTNVSPDIRKPHEEARAWFEKARAWLQDNLDYLESLPKQTETTDSGAFASSVPENMTGMVYIPNKNKQEVSFGGKTGEELNAEAKANIEKMKQGFGNQL